MNKDMYKTQHGVKAVELLDLEHNNSQRWLRFDSENVLRPRGGSVDHSPYPLDKVRHSGVDAVFALIPAAFSEAGDPVRIPARHAVFNDFTHERAAAISGAGIHTALVITCAHLVRSDFIVKRIWTSAVGN